MCQSDEGGVAVGVALGIVLWSSVRGGEGMTCSSSKRGRIRRRKISSRLRFS